MTASSSTGLVVFAHGSRVEAANAAVRSVAAEAARQARLPLYRAAFLELCEPTLAGAVAQLAAEGVRHVVVTPYFLTMGRHLTVDLPRLIAEIRVARPQVLLETTPPLDGHPQLAAILAGRARALLDAGERPDRP